MSKHKRWTKQEVKHLILYYQDPKMSIDQICEKLDREYNSVVLKASRIGIKRPITYIQNGFISENGDPDVVNYNPLTNQLIIYRPWDIDELMNKIIEIKTGISPDEVE
jgi:hypothetical protein